MSKVHPPELVPMYACRKHSFDTYTGPFTMSISVAVVALPVPVSNTALAPVVLSSRDILRLIVPVAVGFAEIVVMSHTSPAAGTNTSV